MRLHRADVEERRQPENLSETSVHEISGQRGETLGNADWPVLRTPFLRRNSPGAILNFLTPRMIGAMATLFRARIALAPAAIDFGSARPAGQIMAELWSDQVNIDRSRFFRRQDDLL
jgi:hypothetical protein